MNARRRNSVRQPLGRAGARPEGPPVRAALTMPAITILPIISIAYATRDTLPTF
jgi:hypothetical protein